MKRTAVVYFSSGKLIIAPVIRTSVGVRLEVDPVRLDNPDDESAIREGLIEALEGSQRVVPHPSQDQWKGFFKPFQDAAGVRSFKAFMKNAKSIYIDASDNQIRLTPLQNFGNREGLEEMPNAAVILPLSDMDRAVSVLQRLLGANGS